MHLTGALVLEEALICAFPVFIVTSKSRVAGGESPRR
jgi:hypothetical protein